MTCDKASDGWLCVRKKKAHVFNGNDEKRERERKEKKSKKERGEEGRQERFMKSGKSDMKMPERTCEAEKILIGLRQ